MDSGDKQSIFWIVIGIVLVCMLLNLPQQSKTMTQEEAKYEYCLLVTQLKYPTSSTDIVKRLCELEQIGRLKG